MAGPKTRKERQRAREHQRREAAGRLFRRSVEGLIEDKGEEAPSAPPPVPSTPSLQPLAHEGPPSTPAESDDDADVSVQAFFSLEEREVRPTPGTGTLGGDEDSGVTFQPLIDTETEDTTADAAPWSPDVADDSASAPTAEFTDRVDPLGSTPEPGPSPAPGLNALGEFAAEHALVRDVTPLPPVTAAQSAPPIPDAGGDDLPSTPADWEIGEMEDEPAMGRDPASLLPAGWGPRGGDDSGGTASPPSTDDGPGSTSVVLVDPPIHDPFAPAPGEADASLPGEFAPVDEEEPSGASLSGDPDEVYDDEQSLTEDSADMMFIVLEDTREFPDLEPDQLPPPPVPVDAPPAAAGPETSEETSGAGTAIREGTAALRAGRREEAIERFERALRSDPDDAMAQAYLSLAQELLIRDILPDAGLKSVPRPRVGPELLLTLEVAPELGAVLSMVDGVLDIEALETMLPHLDRAILYRHLATALEQGLIEF